jgi:TolA-binding protein
MADDIDDPIPEPIELQRFDLHGLWRVLLWGASAAMALAIVAGTAFSDLGTDRLKQAVAALIEPLRSEPQQPQVNQQQIAELEKQTRTLVQTVRDLTAERDQVKGRLAILEQSLDDITGTIKRQTAKAATLQPLQEPPQATARQPLQEPPKVAQTPPPTLSAPQTVVAAASPAATVPTSEAPVTTASTSDANPAPEATPAITGPVPMPPTRLASIAPPAAAPEQAPTTREIGVDVGGAASLDALRAHWAALKANIGPELVGLRPSLTTRQKQSGAADYRLVLGPMPNSAAAIRLCTRLVASKIYCRAGVFNVQQFAERVERPRPPEQLPPTPRDSIIVR